MGALAAAWLTTLPDPVTGLSDMDHLVYTQLGLGDAILPRLSDDSNIPVGASEKQAPTPRSAPPYAESPPDTTCMSRCGATSPRAATSPRR